MEGRGKREEGSRKRGNEAKPLDIYSQALPGNKEREQGMQSAHYPDFV